jgi:hypothetical protein
MTKKLDELGLPLDVIKEEFFGNKDAKASKSPSKRRGTTLSMSNKKGKSPLNNNSPLLRTKDGMPLAFKP